ncbi:MAG TPA: cell envelope integrity protein CreD [Candidatus Paceibacterota bacterium]
MKYDTISVKILVIALIGGICFVASLLVMGLTGERQNRFSEAKQEIVDKWSKQQVIVGPMIIKKTGTEGVHTYVLPETLSYEVVLEPETRTRGIFKSVVYTSKIKVRGEFVGDAIGRDAGTVMFSLPITDTRGIENQFDLTWNGVKYPLNPGPGVAFKERSGLNAAVPINSKVSKIPFSFELQLKGSESMSIAPLGKETVIAMSSPWQSPKFVGAFLPSEREVTESGFKSEWRISSFGRSFPQTWQTGDVNLQQLVDSGAGVELHEQVDGYDMTFRSVKYAILFIVITFAAFFLFDVRARVRIHPVQYLLIGSALSLFYLLLLSLSEQIGFLSAYLIATAMIALLVTMYSAFVLKSKQRAFPIFAILVVLYGYLYFVLRLEDYALLFGSLLLFALLAVIMFMTRHIDWFALGKEKEGRD